MAWSNPALNAPNFDTGPGLAVPTVAADVPGAAAGVITWLTGATFANTGTVERVVTLTDSAGTLVDIFPVPGAPAPGASLNPSPEWPFRKVLGLKHVADGAGVVAQYWGMQ